MEHECFGRSSRKFPGATEHLKRQSCFSGRNVPKRKVGFHFFNKANFDTCFRLSRPFFGKWNGVCTNGKRDSGTKVTSPNFCLSPKPFTDRFANVNRKQPMPQYRARYQYGVCLNCSSTFWEIEISYKSRGTMKGKRHITHEQISKT